MLCMAAMSATLFNPDMKEMYGRLTKKESTAYLVHKIGGALQLRRINALISFCNRCKPLTVMPTAPHVPAFVLCEREAQYTS